MKPEKGHTVYNLIHSQQMVQFMWRYSLHMQSTQIPFAIAFDEDLDFKILARAVNTEIERNDCMRLRVFRDGFKIRQFFLDEYKLEKILLKDFKSKDEQTTFFDKDAEKKLDIFSGETFRIIFFIIFHSLALQFPFFRCWIFCISHWEFPIVKEVFPRKSEKNVRVFITK